MRVGVQEGDYTRSACQSIARVSVKRLTRRVQRALEDLTRLTFCVCYCRSGEAGLMAPRQRPLSFSCVPESVLSVLPGAGGLNLGLGLKCSKEEEEVTGTFTWQYNGRVRVYLHLREYSVDSECRSYLRCSIVSEKRHTSSRLKRVRETLDMSQRT